MAEAKIRLYVDQPLAAGQPVSVGADQANYLFNVMRLVRGDGVSLFNGRDGAWLSVVEQVGKRTGMLVCQGQTGPQVMPPDLWLMFAPLKKARTDFIVEKAVELGVARIVPVQTQFTNAERVRQDKLQAHAVEAAEQCGATFVPDVAGVTGLAKALDGLGRRRVLWCDEGLAGRSLVLSDLLTPGGPEPWAILIGPEGGFSGEERARLRGMPQVVPISLGPRILRADTAAVAALVLWQAALGEWR